jgi:hypothetical protein
MEKKGEKGKERKESSTIPAPPMDRRLRLLSRDGNTLQGKRRSEEEGVE